MEAAGKERNTCGSGVSLVKRIESWRINSCPEMSNLEHPGHSMQPQLESPRRHHPSDETSAAVDCAAFPTIKRSSSLDSPTILKPFHQTPPTRDCACQEMKLSSPHKMPSGPPYKLPPYRQDWQYEKVIVSDAYMQAKTCCSYAFSAYKFLQKKL